MSPQVYFVTGANKGLGYETVRILAEKFGDQAVVLLGTRSLKNGEDAIAKMKQVNSSFDYANVQLVEIDVSKKESIQAAADFVKGKYGHLHVLINNAGVGGTKEGPEVCFQVNVFGVVDTWTAFQSLLVPHQSTHIIVASMVGAWTLAALSPELQTIFENFNALDIDSLRALLDDWLAYSQGKASKYSWPTSEETTGPYGTSKTAVMALTRKWAFDHPDVKTVIVSPGYCATDINGHSGFTTAAEGGEHIVHPILHPEATETGGFYRESRVQSFKILECRARTLENIPSFREFIAHSGTLAGHPCDDELMATLVAQ
ncbi:hypothetical protein AeMF1_007011 [Aphanomyces euteiches]|nr:hypothetical protein AeMF1_007011 [Aphanomyces euteiches]